MMSTATGMVFQLIVVNPYQFRAVASAFDYLGQYPESNTLLKEYALDDSKIGQHSLVRCGALKALGHTRSKEAYDFLKVELEKPRYHRETASILVAIGNLAFWMEDRFKKEATELVSSYLTNEHRWIRFSTVMALFAMKAKDQVGNVLSTRSMYTLEEWVFVDKRIKKLRESGAPEEHVKALQKTVEELEGKIKSLEAEVKGRFTAMDAEKKAKEAEQVEKKD